MELRTGFMHKRELAAFFHKSEKSFMNHKSTFDRYCKVLEDYAVFTVVRGGVNITEILDEAPYDEIVFDLDRGIKEAIELAPPSQYIKNGKILTSTGILWYIIQTQGNAKEAEMFKQDEKLCKRFQQRISYRLRKMNLLNDARLDTYWGCLMDGILVELQEQGRMLVPLLKNKKECLLTSYKELSKEDKELLEELLGEEEANDTENSKLAAYHLLDNAEYYKGNEKAFYEEAKRVCKPFYRAMKRFNEIKNQIYLSNGTLIVE